MRKIKIGSDNFTEIFAKDKPGQGNACHEYIVKVKDNDPVNKLLMPCVKVSFQNGPIKESGINGCHNEDLISIVLDRLHGFQSGDFFCRENDIAITKLEESLHWLNHRTQKRIERGVEGKHII